MARLDRLGQAEEIAQVAAIIGRQFSRTLLAAVAPVNAGRRQSKAAAQCDNTG